VFVIPAFQEVEIGRSRFAASPGKKLGRSHLKKQAGVVVYFCNFSDAGRKIVVQGWPWQIMRTYLKNNIKQRPRRARE
jgi:hypothetical protein